MSNKSKVKSTRGISEHCRKKSTVPNNLYISPSLIGKFRKFVGRKQKSRRSKTTLTSENTEVSAKDHTSNDATRLTTNLPKDAAAHFGAFYGVQGNNAKKTQDGKTKSFAESSAATYKSTPRLEFTRQMVQKLERTAGTEEYARQVSALLEETVEPAHFKLHSLPAENSIPDGRYNPSGYPLWYKEPYKMPFPPDEMYKLLRDRLDNKEGRAKDIFDDESSDKSSWEELSEYDEEDVQQDFTGTDNKNLSEGEEKSLVTLTTTGSSSVTETKDTDSKDGN